MREILFRAKRADNNEWAYGSLRVIATKGDVFIDQLEMVHEKDVDEFGNNAKKMYYYTHQVKPETVGQFTGLTDESGGRIYEGDKIWADGSYELVVEWNSKDACFEANLRTTKSGHPDDDNDDYCSACDFEGYTITGSIHDSPELLGGGR